MRICWRLFAGDTHHCGSWLASDGGGSGNINCGCAGLIAGKPAPTGDWVIGLTAYYASVRPVPSRSRS
ncbi:hypothetical protein PkP19E3_15765 [Pseudomonas koreensis]|nr:hypothetical protein PkP19E3_15765 [Pseudomonas koreensis]